MLTQPMFPPHRRLDPKRRAEMEVYEAIANSTRPGRALYEVKTSATVPELDFALLLEGQAVVGLQVKGGPHVLKRAQWKRITDQGPVNVPDPISLTWDSAMQIREVAQKTLRKKVFVIPMIVFPDMQHDPVIEARAAEAKVKALFGAEDLVERIIDALAGEDIFNPPSSWLVDSVAEALMPCLAEDDYDLLPDFSEGPEDGPDSFDDLCTRGPVRPTPPASPPQEAASAPTGVEETTDVEEPANEVEHADVVDLVRRQPIIQHAEVVNVFNAPTTIYQGTCPGAGGATPEDAGDDSA